MSRNEMQFVHFVAVFVLAILVCGCFGLSLWPFWSDLWSFWFVSDFGCNPLSFGRLCLQCFDTVVWVAGRASGL